MFPYGFPLAYPLVGTYPAGLGIDSRTGLITWPDPEVPPGGRLNVEVEVSDGSLFTLAFFQIGVTALIQDGQIEITSTYTPFATLDVLYTYAVIAVDKDPLQTLHFALLGAVPEGMRLDPDTGLLTWTPRAIPQPTPEVAVTIEVTDDANNIGLQNLTLTVVAGRRPVIVAGPRDTTINAGETFDQTVKATDPTGEALTYELVQWVEGATIDAASGEITWTIPGDYADSDSYFQVVAVNADGVESNPWYFTVHVVEDDTPPEADLATYLNGTTAFDP